MGIKVEFNPDLALRAFSTQGRLKEECLPEKLEVGNVHYFLKEGQRNYWLEGEIPLRETKGNQQLSRPLASITILEARHFINNGTLSTDGLYRIEEVFKKDATIHFEGMDKIKS